MWPFKKKVVPPPVQEVTSFEWVMDCEAFELAEVYLRKVDKALIQIAQGHVTKKDRHGNPLITADDVKFAGETILNSIDEWASVMD